MNGLTGSPTPTVLGELGNLSSMLIDLNDQVGILEERITPLLGAGPPTDIRGEVPGKSPCSTLLETVRGRQEQVQKLIDRVRYTTARIDL
jgi:hypothetical protein